MSNSINMQAVQEMFDKYHAKVKSNPDLYTNARDKNHAIVVVLPKELLDWANRGAGHSGFAANARPVGIRKNVNDAKSALTKIFSSVDNLVEFIKSSECDAEEMMAEVRERHARRVEIITIDPLDRPMSEFNIETLYGKGTIMMLRTKFPKTVMDDYKTLTRGKFESRYELVATEVAV
jgi:hypothetical protein